MFEKGPSKPKECLCCIKTRDGAFYIKTIFQCLFYIILKAAILFILLGSHVRFLFLPCLIFAVVFLSLGFNGALHQDV